MAFTYTEDLTVARDYVRFYTGDTVENESFLSDAIITSLVATSGSNNNAVRAGIQYIIRQLSKPNFTADWLTVSYQEARKGYETMLAEWDSQTGYGVISTTVVTPYRQDSSSTAVPDWTYGRGSEGNADEYDWVTD